jgi:cell division protein FtsL
MRFSVTTFATVIVAAISSVTAQTACTTNFVGTPEQLQAAQQQAIADFGNLFLVQKQIQRGFDLFIPG